MRFSPVQMDELTLIFEQRYIEGLVKNIASWGGVYSQIDMQEIGDIFRWLKQQGIKDDRSIRGLFRLLYERDYLELKKIPAEYNSILCTEGEEGVYKAEILLLRELGDVPL